MLITAYFSNEGTPETGLTPTIRIRDCGDNSLVVTDINMLEIGDGAYKYDFVDYDEEINYFIRCDGGATLDGNDRYVFAGNENQILEERTTEIDSVVNIINGNVDVAVSSRSSHTPVDVDSQLSGTHGVGDWLSADLSTLASDIAIIKKVETGRWKIVGNQMIFYDDDGVTPLLTFDLKDAVGNPTMINPMERILA